MWNLRFSTNLDMHSAWMRVRSHTSSSSVHMECTRSVTLAMETLARSSLYGRDNAN
jgi:hypothetical protein